MAVPPGNRQKRNFHVVFIKFQFGHISIYQGPVPKGLQEDIGKVMAKHNLIRLEVMLVPCQAEQVIRFEPAKKEPAGSGEDPNIQ